MHSIHSLDLSAEPSALRGLSPEQKDRLTEILDRYLLGLESGVPSAREELLSAHPDLAEPLEKYLRSLDELHEVAAGFGGPARRSGTEADSAGGDDKRLGDFRIVREIGRGGMGVVYEAQQISLGRRVALKVLPFAAVLDSRQIARFQHEAQAAARLDHPNIVSVFAIGVERGVHYYAMQLVEGQSLDRALAELRKPLPAAEDARSDDDAAKATAGDGTPPADACPSTCSSFLTAKSTSPHEYIRAAVGVAIQAAEALHAAHEHGVIHRDIKPSNLLLDGDGKVWVTDFGLARCQSDVTLTRTGDVMGTYRYMSPEQATGQSPLVDHRTDIYSLGTTLYELLAREPAFAGDDGPALLRRIEQQEPRRLRLIEPKVPADLEIVVSKAMAKRREERYAAAQEFADDLRRVLEGKPTIARPPTIPQRIGKWAYRHKRVVSAAAAVCVLAALGMAVSTLLIAREKNKAERNFARAEKNFHEAQEAVHRFGALTAERLLGVPRAEGVRKGLLQETLNYYRDFVNQAKENPALRADLALTYSKIGMLTASIGSIDDAIEADEWAIRLFEQLVAEQPRQPEYRRRLAVSRSNLALVLSRAGKIEAARRAYHEAIRLQKELVDSSKDDGSKDLAQYLSDLALSHTNLGKLQSETNRAKDAEVLFREAIDDQQRLVALQPDNPDYRRNLAASLNNLSALYIADQPGRAADLHRKALAHQTKAAAMRPQELVYQNDVALTYNNLGSAQSRQGKLAEAAASYARAVEIQRGLVRVAPAQTSYQHDLAVSFNNLGMAQSKLGKATEAERSFRQALDVQEALVSRNPHDLDLQSSLGGIYNNLGIVLQDLKRIGEAAKSYRQAVEHQRIANARAPEVSRYRVFLSKHYYNYGYALRLLGRPDEAARAALARKELWPNDPQHLFAVAEELALTAKLFASSGRTDAAARECAGSAVETLRQAMAAGWKPTGSGDWTGPFAAVKDQPGFARLVKK